MGRGTDPVPGRAVGIPPYPALSRDHFFRSLYSEPIRGERMRRHRLRKTAATTGLAAGAVDDPARRRALGVMTGKEPVLRLADSPPVAQHRQQLRGEHHIPVPLPFSLDDAEHHPLAVNRRHGQPHGFRDAKARGIAGRQDGAMLGASAIKCC